MNNHEREQLLFNMDAAAYRCAGVLRAIVDHTPADAPIPPAFMQAARRELAAFQNYIATYQTEDAIMVASGEYERHERKRT